MSSNTQDYILNKLFTVPSLDRMVCEHDTKLFAEVCRQYVSPESRTYGACIHDVYQYMRLSYKNEYYFKNKIFNQLLLENHDIFNTAAFTEFPIGESKADFVMINRQGVIYEIKTDLDNFSRLRSQISDYYKVFPYVNVVVGYKQFSKIKTLLEETPVGIFVLYNTDHLMCRKKAVYCDAYLSYEDMFHVLRKKEFEKIILKHWKKLPETNDFNYYRECRKWLGKLEKRVLYRDMLDCLKNRRLARSQYEALCGDLRKVPYELRFYAYFTRKCNCDWLSRFCEKKMEVGDVLSIF